MFDYLNDSIRRQLSLQQMRDISIYIVDRVHVYGVNEIIREKENK